jgi:hypothetical protein
MPDFTKGKIYRLTCDDPELIYYGSTTETLSSRLSKHKYEYKIDSYKKCSSSKLYEVGGVDIELVLECPCNSKKELEEVERTYIENDNCVNKYIPQRTKVDRHIQIKKHQQTEKFKKYQYNYNRTEEYKLKAKIRYQKRKEAKIKNIV